MPYTYEPPDIEVGKISRVPVDHPKISTDIFKAKSGDPEAANRVLARFVDSVEKKAPIDDRIVEFILESFKTALTGESLDKAFGLARGEGRPTSPDTGENYLKYFRYVLQERRSGSTYQNAVYDTAEHFQVSDSTIKLAYREVRNLLDEIWQHSTPVSEADLVAIQRLVRPPDP